MTNTNQNPALAAVKKHRDIIGETIELSSGIKAILSPVGMDTIIEAQTQILDPPVPIEKREDGREFENPNSPEYISGIREARIKRAQAALDVMLIMGVTLVDGLPENDGWLTKLKQLARRGRISLEGYDLDDELDRDLLYKRHIAMSGNDWTLLSEMSGVNAADIEAAEALF